MGMGYQNCSAFLTALWQAGIHAFFNEPYKSRQLSVVSKSFLVWIYSQFSEGLFECRSIPAAFKITASSGNW